MMADSGSFAYLRGAKFQAVRLPYYHAAMYVFLPDENSSLHEFEQSLTADKWDEWTRDFEDHEGYLELPRFRSEYRADVKAILPDLGVERAFTTFGSFAPAVSNPEGAALTRVLQAILLSVDEKGNGSYFRGRHRRRHWRRTRSAPAGTVSNDREPSVLLGYL
jgi:serine protease inhibitor